MQKKNTLALALISLMFFNIGVMFCMNDVLLPVVRDAFQFNYVKATLIQVSFYIVYLIWPFPIAWSVKKFGYPPNIIASLVLSLAGCLLFIPAFYLNSYGFILAGVFVLSTGITIANVAANPYVTLLGAPDKAHVRLNLVQAMSRVGYAVTPVAASALIYQSSQSKPAFHIPYLLLSAILVVAVILFFAARIPPIPLAEDDQDRPAIPLHKEFFRHRVLFFGVVTMFFYLGVESCTAGFFMSLCKEKGFDTAEAASYLTGYYVLAASFALIGTLLLSRIKAGRLLGISALLMAICLLMVVLLPSVSAVYFLTLAGGFMAIMFPTVFSLSLEGLGTYTEKGSALLNVAIAGGALFPPLQGAIADASGVASSYVVPLVCCAVVASFGFSHGRPGKSK